MPPKYSDDQLLRCMLILSSRDDNGIRVPLSSSANDEAAGSNTPVTITDTLLLSAAIALREVSHSNLPRILFLFDSWDNNVGFHSVLIRILRSTSSSSISPLPTAIVFNVLWMVTEVISYGMNHSYTKLMELGILPLMIEKLEDEDMNIVEQAGWGLGNLAGDSTKQRDLIYEADGVAAALRAVRNPKLHAGGRWKITWAMSNLCRGMPSPRPEQVTDLLFYFTEVMMKFIDSRIENGDDTGDFERETVDVLWGICYLSEGGDDEVPYGVDALPLIVEVMSIPQGIVEPGFGNAPVMNRLVPCEQMSYAMEYLPRADLERLCMLNSDIWNCCVCANRRLYNRVRSTVYLSHTVRVPAVRIMGNIATGNTIQTQALIDSGALRIIESIARGLNNPTQQQHDNNDHHSEWKEVMWLLSNITAGISTQARRIVNNDVFYYFVIVGLSMTTNLLIGAEAAWVVEGALRSVPEEVPLAWVVALLGYLAYLPEDSSDELLERVMTIIFEYCPELCNTALLETLLLTNNASQFTTTPDGATHAISTGPEYLLALSDNYTREDCICIIINGGGGGDNPEDTGGANIAEKVTNMKFTSLIRDHALPVLLSAGTIVEQMMRAKQ